MKISHVWYVKIRVSTFQSQNICRCIHWEKHQRSHKQLVALFTNKPSCLPSSAVTSVRAEHSWAIYKQGLWWLIPGHWQQRTKCSLRGRHDLFEENLTQQAEEEDIAPPAIPATTFTCGKCYSISSVTPDDAEMDENSAVHNSMVSRDPRKPSTTKVRFFKNNTLTVIHSLSNFETFSIS